MNTPPHEAQLNKVLLSLSKLQAVDQGDLEEVYEKVTEAVARALSIERVSLWFYNEERTSIRCAKLYEVKNSEKYSEGHELKAQDFPSYFKYLSTERYLLADEARTNPVTIEFLETYLKPLNIFSMLDAPIRVNGKMIGVICSEKTDELRIWSQQDSLFLGNIADILARAIQAQERRLALERLKENNKKLEKQKAAAEHSSKMALLGEMAGSIAHEINNPLSIILSSVEILRTMDVSNTLTKKKRLETYTEVENTLFRIVDIIKGLRFFARDASHDDFLEASLNEIVNDTLSLCKNKLMLSECDLRIEGISESMKIKCQPVAISQALLNLISNSYDAIKEQNEKWIKIDCSEKSDYYVLRIQDSGKGVSKELREKIMLPFFTTKQLGKGTGLGLSIVKGIIESHDGSFFLDEKANNTSFVLKLPKPS